MPVLIVPVDADGECTILILMQDLILLFLCLPRDSSIRRGWGAICVTADGALRFVPWYVHG